MRRSQTKTKKKRKKKKKKKMGISYGADDGRCLHATSAGKPKKKKKEEREKRLHQQGSRVGGVRGRGGPPLSCF
jgi:hypothetical protein